MVLVGRALTPDAETAAMRGATGSLPCVASVSEREDARILDGGDVGVLLVVACVGLYTSASNALPRHQLSRWIALFPFAASTLPSFNLWMFSLMSRRRRFRRYLCSSW